ncbi:MAG: DUF4258 domain-containing protein [Deltaproteobacteria bacterium]|nr:DUF4258 domain-containing protein [Deltaproteobacteria bacterium]
MSKPPDNPVDAKKWVKAAVEAGRYLFAPIHFPQRLRERKETLDSVKAAIARADRVEPYPSMPVCGGTCWRVEGMGTNGKRVAIGVELFLDDENKWTAFVTVIDLTRKTIKGRRR